MLYQARVWETGPLSTPLGLVGLAYGLIHPSRPPRDQVQLELRTQQNLLGLHESFVLENCEAMELHEVEKIEIVSAQDEDMKYLHRQKTEVLELEAEFEEPEQIQKVGTWRTERVASEVDNPLPTAPDCC